MYLSYCHDIGKGDPKNEVSLSRFRICKALGIKSKSFLTVSKTQENISLPYLSRLVFSNFPFTPQIVSCSNTNISRPLMCRAPSYYLNLLISAAFSLPYQSLHLVNFHSTVRTRTITTSFSAVSPASNKFPGT